MAYLLSTPRPPTVPNPHEDSISFSDVTATTVHTIRPGPRLLWKLDWSLCLHIGHYPHSHPQQPDLDYRYCMRAACPARSVVLIYRLLSEEFHNVIKIPTNPKYKYQFFSQDTQSGGCCSSLAHVKYEVPVFSIWNLDLLVATLNMKHAATINTE